MMDIDKLVGCGPYVLTHYSQEQGLIASKPFKITGGPNL